MKFQKRSLFISILIILITIMVLIGGSFVYVIKNPFKISKSEVINIKAGESFYGILNKLAEENKIRTPIFIKAYAKLNNENLELMPGSYTIHNNMSVNDFIAMLNEKPEVTGVELTVPEGFTIDDIALKLQSLGICTSDEFISAIKAYPLPSYVSANEDKRYNLEGFLFPDTYTIEPEENPEDIITMMIERFEEVWNENTSSLNIDDSNIERIINIAAMIEKEARVDEDRALISSVIYNRLDIDMPLQICATVIYAHGYNIEDIREGHLAIESKYNTYLYKGLPVGPISNPGIKSIMAAINPASTDYLFYLLEGEGKHYFTNNYEDFENKKAELGY